MPAFEKMKHNLEKLQVVHAHALLAGFVGDKVYPVGTDDTITLPCYCRTWILLDYDQSIMVNFLLVNCPSTYNTFIG